MRRFLLTCVACWVLSACSNEFPDKDLSGSYVASYKGEIGTLSLKPDHSYVHVVRTRDRRITEAEGSWRAVATGPGQTAVELPNFRGVPSYEVKSAGWVIEVDRTWLGRPHICVDDDVGYCYVRRSEREG